MPLTEEDFVGVSPYSLPQSDAAPINPCLIAHPFIWGPMSFFIEGKGILFFLQILKCGPASE